MNAFEKIVEIYENVQSKKFVVHLIKAYLNSNSEYDVVKIPPYNAQCCITNKLGYNEEIYRSFAVQLNLNLNLIKSSTSNSNDSYYRHQHDMIIKKINKMWDLEKEDSYVDLLKNRILYKSKTSDKYISHEALTALKAFKIKLDENFYQNAY